MSNEQEQVDLARLQQTVAERANQVTQANQRGTFAEVRQAYIELSRAMFACKRAETAEG